MPQGTQQESQQNQGHAVFPEHNKTIQKRPHTVSVPHLCFCLALQDGLVKLHLFLPVFSCHFCFPAYFSKSNVLSLFTLELTITYFLLQMQWKLEEVYIYSVNMISGQMSCAYAFDIPHQTDFKFLAHLGNPKITNCLHYFDLKQDIESILQYFFQDSFGLPVGQD